MFTQDRRKQIIERVAPLLRAVDPDARLHEALLDSTRTQLVLFLQKGEWPIVIGMDYLDFVSLKDPELRLRLEEGLRARLVAAERRLAAGEDV